MVQALLPGIATACVDNTSGDIFKTPASVAAGLRQEMVEYITQRSESFVAKTVIVEGELRFHRAIRALKDECAQPGLGLDDEHEREERGQDNGFWLMDKREAIARALLINVDYTKAYHCFMRFGSEEDLAEHVQGCSFGPTTCESECCNAAFSKRNAERHDSVTHFKIILCEQMCSGSVMRRAMDVTVIAEF